MSVGPHVFRDGRLGVWIVSPANLPGRLAGLRALGFTDVFLPRTATKSDVERVRVAGFVGAHLWEAVDGETADEYAERVLADVRRLAVGAADLNVELGSDAALEPFMRRVLRRIRSTMPSRRLRLNVAWRKAGFLPVDLLVDDPNLFACEQNYLGGMEPCSAADALEHLLAAGVPREKAAVCFGGAGPVPPAGSRVATFPTGFPPSRGVVFQDDLLAEVGLL